MKKLMWSEFEKMWSTLEELGIYGSAQSWRRFLKGPSGINYIYYFNSHDIRSQEKGAFELEDQEGDQWETVLLIDRNELARRMSKEKEHE